jgi:hypothetical protein
MSCLIVVWGKSVRGRGYWQMKKKGLKMSVPPLRPPKKLNATCVYVHRKSTFQREDEESHQACEMLTAEKIPENKISHPRIDAFIVKVASIRLFIYFTV